MNVEHAKTALENACRAVIWQETNVDATREMYQQAVAAAKEARDEKAAALTALFTAIKNEEF